MLPLGLGEVGRNRNTRVNPHHGRQHYNQASLPDVWVMPPVPPGPEGAQSPDQGDSRPSWAGELLGVVTCAVSGPHLSQWFLHRLLKEPAGEMLLSPEEKGQSGTAFSPAGCCSSDLNVRRPLVLWYSQEWPGCAGLGPHGKAVAASSCKALGESWLCLCCVPNVKVSPKVSQSPLLCSHMPSDLGPITRDDPRVLSAQSETALSTKPQGCTKRAHTQPIASGLLAACPVAPGSS
ncbi:hypothetical protein HJG60_011035 [Phyllostomus discolor]|uniref:Uncharacterized protein n=1 Tax=Phyllostomus discolor TaxID=89673 RepID=A0A834AFA5_9CHIR|nr:hypothetical protein HJG60_011035 [Phyllostomus discolor]